MRSPPATSNGRLMKKRVWGWGIVMMNAPLLSSGARAEPEARSRQHIAPIADDGRTKGHNGRRRGQQAREVPLPPFEAATGGIGLKVGASGWRV